MRIVISCSKIINFFLLKNGKKNQELRLHYQKSFKIGNRFVVKCKNPLVRLHFVIPK